LLGATHWFSLVDRRDVGQSRYGLDGLTQESEPVTKVRAEPEKRPALGAAHGWERWTLTPVDATIDGTGGRTLRATTVTESAFGSLSTRSATRLAMRSSSKNRSASSVEEISDRLAGLLGGYFRWSGMVPDTSQAIVVTERLLGRQLGPEGRGLITAAANVAEDA